MEINSARSPKGECLIAVYTTVYCFFKLPKLSRKRVDSFTSKGKRKVPSCQLQATLSHNWGGYIPERSHLITLQGAKEPDNQMVLVFAAVNARDTLTHTFHNTEQGVAPLSVQEPGMLTYLGTVLYSVCLYLNQVSWPCARMDWTVVTWIVCSLTTGKDHSLEHHNQLQPFLMWSKVTWGS